MMQQKEQAKFALTSGNRTVLLVAVSLLCLGLGFFLRPFVDKRFRPRLEDTGALREIGKFTYINPLLLCDAAGAEKLTYYGALEKKVQQFITNHATIKNTTVAVYFRDLNKGQWFGIHEDGQFSPASLLKVPVMIAYFKLAESDPEILSKVLVYDGSFDFNTDETFRSKFDIKAGAYKVIDLIRAMVVNSDNNALQLLYDSIDQKFISEVYTDLGLPEPAENSVNAALVSAKSYSYFFRVLFNATYLDREFSEKALKLLAGPDFPQGIKAGVPENLAVAQKFGERTVLASDTSLQKRELHDCGIIYYPSRPDLLCVMTRGNNFNDEISIMQGISRIVYEAVHSEFAEQ